VNDGKPALASSRVLPAGSSNLRCMVLPSSPTAAMVRFGQATATGGPRKRSIRRRMAASTVPAASICAGTLGTAGTGSNCNSLAVPSRWNVLGTLGTANLSSSEPVPRPETKAGTPKTRQIRACPQRPQGPHENGVSGICRDRRQPMAWPGRAGVGLSNDASRRTCRGPHSAAC
jgi:hypothetical protein